MNWARTARQITINNAAFSRRQMATALPTNVITQTATTIGNGPPPIWISKPYGMNELLQGMRERQGKGLSRCQ
jgi:hypothetical protein